MGTRVASVGTIAALVTATGLCVSAQAAPRESLSQPHQSGGPHDFRWFEPALAPRGWKRLSPPSGGAILFYPPSLARIHSDRYSASVAKKDRSGRVLVYLNTTPKQGDERLDNWPDFRLRHNREESRNVHEDARASGLWFIGGKGSCVIDHYVTKSKHNHYREIACFVQGRTKATVIVAAALQSEWTRALPLLERAVEAYQVT